MQFSVMGFIVSLSHFKLFADCVTVRSNFSSTDSCAS